MDFQRWEETHYNKNDNNGYVNECMNGDSQDLFTRHTKLYGFVAWKAR